MQLGYFADFGTFTGFGIGSNPIPYTNLSNFYAQIPLNQWSHFAFVRSGTSGTYYLNGAQVGTTVTANTSVNYGTSSFTIGCDYRQLLSNANPRCFAGYMSTFIILNRAMSITDISADYNTPSWATPPPAAGHRRRHLAQTPTMPPPSLPTCLSLSLSNSSGALAPSAPGGGNTSWDWTFAPLTAGFYSVVPSLLDNRGQLVSAAAPMTFTVLPPPSAAPPPPPLAGALSIGLQVFVPVSSYTDATAQSTVAAAVTAVSTAVVPQGGLAPSASLSNLSVLLPLNLVVQGRRHALQSSGNISAIAAAVAAAPQIVALLATGNALGPVTTQLVSSSMLQIEVFGVVGTSAAAVSNAANALSSGWIAAATLPTGVTTATPASGGAVVRLNLQVQGGVVVASDSSSGARSTVLVLNVANAGANAAQGSALGSALAPVGVTQYASVQQMCYTAPGGVPQCASSLSSFSAMLVSTQLGTAASNASAASNGTSSGNLALTDVSAIGTLLNFQVAGAATNTSTLAAQQLPLLSTINSIVVAAGGSTSNSSISASGIAAVAAVLNINITAAAYQGNTSYATGAALPTAVVSAGLDVLALLAPSAAASSLSSAALANITTALLAASGTQNGTSSTLTRSSVDDAMAIYAAIISAANSSAANPVTLTPSIIQSLVTGLSLAATSPGAAQPRTGDAPTAYAAAGATSTALAAIVASQLSSSCVAATSAGSAAGVSAAAGAPGVGLSVSCHAAGSSSSPLYTTGVSAPGGLATLSPVPLSMPLNNASAVTVTLLAVAFDTHGGAGAGGITVQISFANAATGAVIPIANLSQPLTFQIATPPGGPGGSVLFWNSALNAYSDVGVEMMPNPAPPGAVLSWRSGFNASSATDLPLAWTLSLPGCVEQLVNCSDSWESSLSVSLDPQQSIGSPVMACGGNTTGMRRAFVGHNCSLWQPGGGSGGCGWNVSSQAFYGAGCILDPITRVATLHTTDFFAGPAPRIELPPPAAFAPPSASELRRMAPLLIILLVLFAGMHLLALLLNVRDQADMARALARSRSYEMGCRCSADGLYTWRLQQVPVESAVAGIRGSAVEFAALIGVPYARLALALPSALFGGVPLRWVTGRAGGISGSALQRHHDLLMLAATRGLRDDDLAPDGELAEGKTASGIAAPSPVPLLASRPASSLRAADQAEYCLICLEPLQQSGVAVMVAPCMHCFHVDCVQSAVAAAHNTRCPVCFTDMNARHAAPAGWQADAMAKVREQRSAVGSDHLWLTGRLASTPTVPLSHSLAAMVHSQLHTNNKSDGGHNKPGTGQPRASYARAARARSYGNSDLLDYLSAPAAAGRGARTDPPDLLQLSSTALVQAYQATYCLVSAEEIANQQIRYIRALTRSGVDPEGAKFMRLFGVYKELLMGPIFSSTTWVCRARLFRVVLAYDFEDGGWDATDALAVALQANDAKPPPAIRGGLQRVLYYAQAAVSSVVLGVAGDNAADTSAAQDAASSAYDDGRRLGVQEAQKKKKTTQPSGKMQKGGKIMTPLMEDDESLRGGEVGEGGSGELEWLDDPLHFTGGAVMRSVPLKLRRAFGGDSRGAARAWATALAVAWLQQQDASWLITDPFLDNTPRTLADAGAASLAEQLTARCGPQVAQHLADELYAAASPQLTRWAAAADVRVTAARAAHALAPFYVLSQGQRVVCSVLNSIVAQCNTIAMCFSLYSVGTRRYMSAIALASGLLAALLVNVGLYWSKGAICCGNRLGAPPDTAAGAALDTAETRMRHAAFGLMYAIWAVFGYLIIVYGRLLLSLLGPASDGQFAKSWLVALGVGQAAELRSFAITAAEAVMVATLLDALWLLPNRRWLEIQLDYASVQAAAFVAADKGVRVTFTRRIWTFLRHYKAVK